MRWPWVSRERFHDALDANERLRQYCDRLWMANTDILDKYHALKVQGATTPEQTPVLDKKSPDPVVEAITAKAGSDRRLRGIMSRKAMEQRALGMDDLEIIQQIEQGVTADEDGIPA